MCKPYTIRLSALSVCSASFVFQLAFPMALPLPLGMLASLLAAFLPEILGFVTFLLTIVTVSRKLLGRACRISSILPQACRLLAGLCLSSVIVINKSCHYDVGGEIKVGDFSRGGHSRNG